MERVVLYSPEGGSLGDVLDLQARAVAAAIEVSDCAVGRAWDEVCVELRQGDTLVLGSLSCFASLNELLGFVAISGVRVHSLAESWFSESPIKDPLDYQRKLYELGSSLHAARTCQGLVKASNEGRFPGRKSGSGGAVKSDSSSMVALVDVLRTEHRLTVVEACDKAGVSVNRYYRKRR